MKIYLLFFCFLALPLSATEILFNSGNYFGNFNIPRRLVNRIENGLLTLDITGRDSGIINGDLCLDPAKLTVLEIRYRAAGLPEKTSGQLYFAGEGAHFDEKHVWILPSLNSDGQFHTLRVLAPLSWKRSSKIRKLRLDMVDQGPGGKIEIEFIRFRSSVSDETLAEWPAVRPELPEAKTFLPPIPEDYYEAVMISAPEDTPLKPGDYYLRKKFTAPKSIETALLQIAVDDKYQLYFNEALLEDRMLQNSWKYPKAYDITKLVRPGANNLIALKYRNEGGPGGALFEIAIRGKDGSVNKYKGQDECRSSAVFNKGWNTLEFDDSLWRRPRIHGTPPTAPWTRVLPYQTLKNMRKIHIIDAKIPEIIQAGSMSSITLSSNAPDGVYHTTIRLKSKKGKTIRSYSEKVFSSNGKMICNFQVPHFFSTMRMFLDLSIREGELSGFTDRLSFQYIQKNINALNPVVSVIQNSHNAPSITINGIPRYCIIGNDLENRITPSVFAPVPVDFRICSLLQTNPENEWQTAPGIYDFSVVDRTINHMLECDGKALVILAVGLEPPGWWAKMHPQELTQYSDGSKCFLHTASPSFASKSWKEQALKSLQALIGHIEKAPYVSRIGGFLLTNGKTYEWQYWGAHESGKMGKMVDYSHPMQERFRSQYHTDLPDCSKRLKANRKMFFDPVKDHLKIAANRMQSETLSEFMIDALNTARKSLRTQKLLGVYYGYHFEYAGYLWTRQLCGHNALARVLKEGRPDFIYSPPSYAIRHFGEAGGDMKPFKSIENAGCLSMIDDDTRTHKIPYSLFSQTLTAEQTRNILRRNFGMALCRGQNLTLLPLNGGNEFDSPETIRDLKIIRAAGNEALHRKAQRHAEIAVVVDEKSFDYLAFDTMNYRNYPRREYRADGTVSSYHAETLRLTGNLISYQRARLGKIGAPVDYLLASDVTKNIGKYKLWIFLAAFISDDTFRNTVAKLRTGRNVLLWFYAPGVIDGKSFGSENIRRLTGIMVRELSQNGSPEILLPDGRIAGVPEDISLLYSPNDPSSLVLGTYLDSGLPAAAEKMTGKARDIFWGGNVMPTDLFRKFAKDAGVHIYSDSNDVIFAGNGFLTFHAATSGRKTIRLPQPARISDLFTGNLLGENIKEFSFNAALHESRIFRIENK